MMKTVIYLISWTTCLFLFTATAEPYKAGSNSGYAMDELNLTGTGIVEEKPRTATLNLFPNPVRSGEPVKLIITDSFSQHGTLTVYCLKGRKLDSMKFPGKPLIFHQPGTYIVRVTSTYHVWTGKLIVH